MAEIDDLIRRIHDLPARSAATVALRAAMRVFPLLASRQPGDDKAFAYWRRDTRRHCLNLLRAYQVSNFQNLSPELSVSDAATARAADAAAATANAAAATARAADAAVRFATDADNAAPAEVRMDVTAALSVDFAIARGDFSAMLLRPLFRGASTDRVRRLWQALQRDLLSLDAGFEVWIDWYQDRVDGRPLNLALEKQWALLPYEILEKSPAEINAHLKALREALAPTDNRIGDRDAVATGEASNDVPPELPTEQQPGLQFAVRKDGKIDLQPSGLAPPDDITEIRAMRGAIIEALDDLIALLEGSNAYGTIARVAVRYKTAISADELSIDQLYAYGIRLENAHAALQREIASGDYPDLAVPAAEALQSIIALHGPTLYSTARGREQIDRARQYRKSDDDFAVYKPVAIEVAKAVGEADNAIAEEARDVIKELADDIGEGPHPERSTQMAHTALFNVITAAAAGARDGVLPEEIRKSVGDGVKDGFATGVIVGAPALAAAGAYAASPAVGAFLLANKALLCDYALLACADLSWLPPFLHWLKRQHDRLYS